MAQRWTRRGTAVRTRIVVGLDVLATATGFGLIGAPPALASCSDQPEPAIVAAAVPQPGSVLVQWQIRCIGDTPDNYSVQSYLPPAADGTQQPGPLADECADCVSIVMRPDVGQLLSYCVTASYLDPAKASATSCTGLVAPAGTVTLEQVDQAGARIRSLGEHTYPTTYAATSVDEQTGSVTISVTQLGAATTALISAANNVPVTLSVVSRSYADIQAVMQSVIGDDAYWTAQGTTLTDIGPDPTNDTLDVGINPYTSVLATAIQQRYGAANVTVSQHDGVESTASRTADSAPYNGGDKVVNGNHFCTAGFGVNGSGTATGPYWIFAGHCWGNGTAIYVPNVSTAIGTDYRSSNVYKDYGMDIAEIGVGAKTSKYIWETNSGRAQSDGSYTSEVTGATVCHSGASLNKVCGTLKAQEHCYWYSHEGLHFCHQAWVSKSSNLVATGDSGGPWFDAYTYNNVRYFSALGMQSGGAGTSSSCSTQAGTQTCYTSAYFTDFDDAVAVYNQWVNH